MALSPALEIQRGGTCNLFSSSSHLTSSCCKGVSLTWCVYLLHTLDSVDFFLSKWKLFFLDFFPGKMLVLHS